MANVRPEHIFHPAAKNEASSLCKMMFIWRKNKRIAWGLGMSISLECWLMVLTASAGPHIPHLGQPWRRSTPRLAPGPTPPRPTPRRHTTPHLTPPHSTSPRPQHLCVHARGTTSRPQDHTFIFVRQPRKISTLSGNNVSDMIIRLGCDCCEPTIICRKSNVKIRTAFFDQ